MFEIGPALRDARERKRLSFSQVEEDTKIRSRYIRALEDEDFTILPGPTYAKGFLRAYADYLGLDGQLFIDEFSARHHDPRDEVVREVYTRPRSKQQRRHRRESGIAMMALAAIVLIAMLVFLASTWSSGNANLPPPVLPPPSSSHSTGKQSSAATHQRTAAAGRSTGTRAHHKAGFLLAIAVSGPCWISTHVGSATGPGAVSTHGTPVGAYQLQPGTVMAIRSTRPVFVSFGAPGSIQSVAVDGRRLKLPYISSGRPVEFTAAGLVAA